MAAFDREDSVIHVRKFSDSCSLSVVVSDLELGSISSSSDPSGETSPTSTLTCIVPSPSTSSTSSTSTSTCLICLCVIQQSNPNANSIRSFCKRKCELIVHRDCLAQWNNTKDSLGLPHVCIICRAAKSTENEIESPFRALRLVFAAFLKSCLVGLLFCAGMTFAITLTEISKGDGF